MGHDKPTFAILAPVLAVTVTIEAGIDDRDEVHYHPGGQGFWIARMLRHLGERPLICGPVGGESGDVIRGLAPRWGIDISPVRCEAASPSMLHDRRSGERDPLAMTPQATLNRHETDELYGRFLDRAVSAGYAVVTGQVESVLRDDFYRRLGSDLASTDVKVVADMHGEDLEAFLSGGPLDMLKLSSENLIDDGVLTSGDDEAVVSAIEDLNVAGARNVVVSRAGEPALALIDGALLEARPPVLEAADFRGTGDSMTAGLGAALKRGSIPAETLKLACGAGAANVTRHGLGSTSDDLVDTLAAQVKVRVMERAAR